MLGLTASHRLVTLLGAGGIGKTRLGIEVARHLLPRFADGVWIAELAPLSDPELVPVAVATALGIDLSVRTVSAQQVASTLASKQLLLVLDNCEHMLDAAASMTEALLRADAAARVIATSREPLRVEGEWIYLVPPLAVPTEGDPVTVDPLEYGAVQLFIERARAAEPRFSPDRRVANAIAAVCRRLDGMPLAIELAAARAAALGVEQFAARLDDRFNLLAGGRRTALPRQQTLRATFDWSYELLTEPERAVLRHLSVFVGSLTLEAASRTAGSAGISELDVIDCVGNLVDKSLVTADVGIEVRYRLLETTRAYALEKLLETGEHGDVARRHAGYYRSLFQRAAAETKTRPAVEWLAVYGLDIDNVRAALDWAFAPGGDVTACTLGPVVQSHQQRGVPSGAHARATLLHGPAGSGWPGRRAHWRAYAWDVPVLPGRSEQCSSSSRAHAQPLHGSPASVPYDPVSIRPAGGRARHSCKGALAAGISGSGHAHGKGQCRGCSRHRSCGFGLAVLGARRCVRDCTHRR